MESEIADDESLLGACGGLDYKINKNGKTTPDHFYPKNNNLLDSGYSSLPPSPSPSFEQNRLWRKSLSLEEWESSPIKKKPNTRRHLRADIEDIKLEIPFDIVPCCHRRISLSNDQVSSTRLSFSPDFSTSRQRFDVLAKLEVFPHVISYIFSCLEGKDLTSVCCVSKKWKKLCTKDEKANSKRKIFLEMLITNKENPFVRQRSKTISEDVPRIKTPLHEHQPSIAVRSAPVMSKFQRFVEVGRYLPRDCHLVKCLNCSSPSKVLSKTSSLAICTKSTCLYQFCYLCCAGYTDGHKCRNVNSLDFETPTTSRIGGRKSRKNLLRLSPS